jgi:hypothetical protein
VRRKPKCEESHLLLPQVLPIKLAGAMLRVFANQAWVVAGIDRWPGFEFLRSGEPVAGDRGQILFQ